MFSSVNSTANNFQALVLFLFFLLQFELNRDNSFFFFSTQFCCWCSFDNPLQVAGNDDVSHFAIATIESIGRFISNRSTSVSLVFSSSLLAKFLFSSSVFGLSELDICTRNWVKINWNEANKNLNIISRKKKKTQKKKKKIKTEHAM